LQEDQAFSFPFSFSSKKWTLKHWSTRRVKIIHHDGRLNRIQW